MPTDRGKEETNMKHIDIFVLLWVIFVCYPSLSLEANNKVWTDPITGMEFVWIEGGCFDMGQTEIERRQVLKEVNENEYVYQGRFVNELPRHKVCVDGFWMGKYEVTNAQYRRWKPNHDSIEYQRYSLNGDDQPVIYIDWDNAKAFAVWLTEKYGNKYTFRLPTEAEWEYACRAGTSTARFWGDTPDKACQHANVIDQTTKELWPHRRILQCADGYAVTAPVGSFRPNSFGLYDMLGNVWEFCEDVYVREIYTTRSNEAPVYNPLSKSGGMARVRRGGGWHHDSSNVRCARRDSESPSGIKPYVGIRLVRID
jgi:formylglycine-generating enzyme required for sulfatase activity